MFTRLTLAARRRQLSSNRTGAARRSEGCRPKARAVARAGEKEELQDIAVFCRTSADYNIPGVLARCSVTGF
eukprot:5478775-Pleurochrysis_carterae.AAC.1